MFKVTESISSKITNPCISPGPFLILYDADDSKALIGFG